MVTKKYIVRLSQDERESLTQLISKGKSSARKLTHGRILLKADVNHPAEGLKDESISQHLQVSRSTIERVRKQFVEEGLENAINRKRPTGRYFRKLDGRGEAHLISLSCSSPPEGRKSWTLHLLAEKLIELTIVESISYETVRQTLKKMNLSPGTKNSG